MITIFSKHKFYILSLFIFWIMPYQLFGQDVRADSVNHIYDVFDERYLLNDLKIQFEITDDINNMYNFNFKEASVGFLYLGRAYPKHPLSDFLMGLMYYWQARPNLEDDHLDERIFKYVDKGIEKGEEYIEHNHKENAEILFLLSACYAIKARIHGERHNWTRAVYFSKKSLSYFDKASELKHFSPEILFGEGLYDYYIEWLKEHYKVLRPVLSFFKDGNKELGLQKIEEASLTAFYTRVEAQLFAVRILSSKDVGQYVKALNLAKRLHHQYPNNPIFHQYYAKLLYFTSDYENAKILSLKILDAIENKRLGYGTTAGRYASFFLGQVYQFSDDNVSAAKYYQKAIEFSEKSGNTDAGYCVYSYIYLGDIEKNKGNRVQAIKYYKKAKKVANRGDSGFVEAKTKLKNKNFPFIMR